MKRLKLCSRESNTELEFAIKMIADKRLDADDLWIKKFILKQICEEFFEKEEFYLNIQGNEYWCRGWNMTEKIILDVALFEVEGIFE